jgi:hypothetical protein
MKMSPNVKQLVIVRMSVEAIPHGSGLEAAIRFLSSRDRLVDGAKSAMSWVEAAILAVRQAGDPNPWKNADDEAIAGELLRQIEERRKKQSINR